MNDAIDIDGDDLRGGVSWSDREVEDDCGESDVPSTLSGVTAMAAGYGHSLAVMPE